MKKKIIEYLAQILLIVFSVVLGLYLNQKMVDFNDRKEAEKILARIEAEIYENKLLIEEWHPYHKRMNENFKPLLSDEIFVKDFIENKDVLLDKLMTKGTFMSRWTVDDAWEIGKSNPIISNIGFEKMLLFSKIYKQQESVYQPVMDMFDLHYSTGVNSELHAKENLNIMSNYLHETVGREILLLEYYDEVFKDNRPEIVK